MKPLIITVCLSMSIALGFMYIQLQKYTDLVNRNKPSIDLPEEYPLISQNSHSPDTLIAFWRNDTLHFKFVVAARNYPQFNH